MRADTQAHVESTRLSWRFKDWVSFLVGFPIWMVLATWVFCDKEIVQPLLREKEESR